MNSIILKAEMQGSLCVIFVWITLRRSYYKRRKIASFKTTDPNAIFVIWVGIKAPELPCWTLLIPLANRVLEQLTAQSSDILISDTVPNQ